MPGVVAFVGAAVLGSVGVAAASAGVIMAVGATTIALAVAGARRASQLKDPIERSNGQAIMVRSTEAPRNIAYGEVLVGGVLTYVNTTGSELRSLYFELVHTGHEVDSFIGWYIDDKYIPATDVDVAGDGSVDTDAGGTHGFTPHAGNPVLYLRRHLGTDAQAVDGMLDTAFTDIGTNHRHRGCAKTVIRCELVPGGESKWGGRYPQSIAAVIRGKKVYDPRADSTFPGGSGAQRLATPSTWAWSDNPALIWADYRILAAPLGPGWASNRINYQSVFDAANACDALVAIPTSATEKRFRCDLVVDASMEPRDVIAKILSSMAGRERHFNGLWHVYAGTWPSSDFALTDNDVIGELQFRKEPQIEDRYNQVKPSFIDRARLWKRVQAVAVNNTSLRTNRDNGRVLTKELDLDGVSREYQAQRVGMLALNQADDTGLLVFPTGYNGLNIRVGDTGTVSIAEFGWVTKTFRCVGVNFIDFQGAELLLKEDASGNYSDPLEGEYSTRTAAGDIVFGTVMPWYFPGRHVEDVLFVSAAEIYQQIGWTQRESGVPNSEIGLVTGLTDVPGGQAARFGNHVGNDEWWGALETALIPYDPNSTYEISVMVRNSSGGNQVYCGFEGVANDRTTMVNVDGNDLYGSQHYIAANAAVPGTSTSAWTTYRGYMRGHGSSPTRPANNPNAPSVARTNVTFIRPMLLLNYPDAAGVVDVVGLWVRRIVRSGTLDLGENAVTAFSQSFAAGAFNMSTTNTFPTTLTVTTYSPPAQNVDCTLQVTVEFETELGDIAGNQDSLIGDGTTSSHTLPVLGSSADPARQSISYQFAYTANSSVTLSLLWTVTPVGSPASNSALYRNAKWVVGFLRR